MILPNDEQIVKVKIGEIVDTSIEILGNTARVCVWNRSLNHISEDFEFSDCEDKPLFGCWFYFGGNRKAPHDITIRYNETDDNICSLLRF
jgi:hypothetical protein